MEYDSTEDIRDHYRMYLRDLDRNIQSRSKRDPTLHKLWAERRLIQSKLKNLPETHVAPVGAIAEYGIW